MATKTDRAGADAIMIATLFNSRLLIANIKNRLAMISNVPERIAYLRQPVGLVKSFLSSLGAKIKVKVITPILAPKRAGSI